jgi:glycosyltransferase involved in cell wall biosynthesis
MRNRSLAVEQERLSVILPVANQQGDLTRRTEWLLEELSELCRSVQIVVVDDGSTDATAEILEQLSCTYPQIQSLRIPRRVGAAQAVDAGLAQADGDFIFLHESYDPLDIGSLTQLWALRHDKELVVARASTRTKRIDQPLLTKLAHWGKSLEEHWKRETKSLESKPLEKGLQMMRRDAVEQVARVDGEQKNLEVSHLSQRRIVRQNFRTHR